MQDLSKTRTDWQSIGRLEMDGIYASLIAGCILLFMEMLVAALFGGGFYTPLVYAASVVMRDRAFSAMPLIPMIAGVSVHVAACAVFGFLFGLVASEESYRVRERWGLQLAVGAVYGGLIWLINFQVIARYALPWF